MSPVAFCHDWIDHPSLEVVAGLRGSTAKPLGRLLLNPAPRSRGTINMTWEPTTTYTARIGGVIYRNVRCPVVLNGASVFTLLRNMSVLT